MSDYDTDILLWSERQGELLRRPGRRRTDKRSRIGLAEHRRGDRGRGAQPTACCRVAPGPGAAAHPKGRGLALSRDACLCGVAIVAGAAWPGGASDDGLRVGSMIADNI